MEYGIVKPKDGRRVKDPRDMALLPAKGRRVRLDRYWRRRIKAGDVEVSEARAVAPQKPAQPKKEGGDK